MPKSSIVHMTSGSQGSLLTGVYGRTTLCLQGSCLRALAWWLVRTQRIVLGAQRDGTEKSCIKTRMETILTRPTLLEMTTCLSDTLRFQIGGFCCGSFRFIAFFFFFFSFSNSLFFYSVPSCPVSVYASFAYKIPPYSLCSPG